MSQPQIKKVIHLPKIRMLGRGRASGIKITNVKTIKPPDPELVKKQEEDRLRQKLQKEIENRSKTCKNKSYDCTLQVLTGREFCSKHILQDPTAPYKQCTYTYNEVKCDMPAPVSHDRRDQGLCFEHARMALIARLKSTAPPAPVTTTETLLNQLQHYVRPERVRTTSCASSVSVVSDPSDQDVMSPLAVDPFKQIDAPAINARISSAMMSCGSGSESEDSVTVGRDGDSRGIDYDSDPEDLDHPGYALRRAGIFTAEEAVSEAKSTLKILQSAYVRQMGRLKVLLHDARYKYLKSLKAEKEQYCNINSQARSGPLTVKERKQLKKLKAYASYHRKYGMDAVLARKLHKKRARVNDVNRNFPNQNRCSLNEGGVKCTNLSLPASKRCLKHVTLDPNQVLFMPCGDPRGGTPCKEPVARLPLPSNKCRYHTDPPTYTMFNLRKEDSDTETDNKSVVSDSMTDGESRSADDAMLTDGTLQDGGYLQDGGFLQDGGVIPDSVGENVTV